MTNSALVRSKMFGALMSVLLSSASMVWFFWRHPVSAGLATLAILSAFGVSAYLARWIEPDSSDVSGFTPRG